MPDPGQAPAEEIPAPRPPPTEAQTHGGPVEEISDSGRSQQKPH